MKRRFLKSNKFLVLLAIGIWICLPACKHEPFAIDDDMVPIDTITNPIDTNMVDTTNMGIPCMEGVVYFNREVLPILKSNCAFSGCHDAASAEDGVILETYESTIQTGEVKAFDLSDSKLYEVLIDTEVDDRMPPAPRPPLSTNQIALVAQWILQGAKNLECDVNAGVCNTENVSFAQYIQPLIADNCQGCHGASVPSGGIDLTNHQAIATVANSGKLVGAIDHQAGYVAMPQGGAKLAQCDIDKIKSWVTAGALNN